jgi:hypothetical protein
MTSRRLAVLVAVAVVAGITVAAVGLATRGSSKPARVLQVDEVTGRVGRVVLDETRQNVVGTLGNPRAVGYAPGDALVYAHLTVELRGGRVVSIETDDPAAQTEKVVRIGDPISAARASYAKAAKCVPNSPDKTAKHSYCRVKVPAGLLVIDGDPIKTMTLVARTN